MSRRHSCMTKFLVALGLVHVSAVLTTFRASVSADVISARLAAGRDVP